MKFYGIETKRGSGGANRIVNHNPFENLNDINTQYWLGFLAADGYISASKYYFVLHQAGQDRFILENFRSFISEDVNIQVYNNSAGSEVWQVMVGNREIHSFLINLGLVPNKSLTFRYLGALTPSFLRGVFDGDGSCSTNKIPKITTSSPFFRDQLVEYFTENGILCNWREKGDKNAINECYDVQILKAGRKPFYDLLYSDFNYCLERKRLSVQAIL